ncbi:ASB18 [Branchiostoma lanceolatum]|uniref:ASB18 protein n=1 Tax=Branchiostoma lanceolatum TaxID=7740 RepID=A0A8J9ZI89_BRALA|nr:ASB18 [Branchiostoma lanceolatum]
MSLASPRFRRVLEEGDKKGVKELVTNGCDVNMEFVDKVLTEDIGREVALGLWSMSYVTEVTTPLFIVVSYGHVDCASYLLRMKADVNYAPTNDAPLHAACKKGHAELVELLLAYKADVNQMNEDGYCPLHLCDTGSYYKCAKALIRRGADIEGASWYEGDTPLHKAAEKGLDDLCSLLVNHGADVNARNGNEATPLIVACEKSTCEGKYANAVLKLIAFGADMNAHDSDTEAALHKACTTADFEVVKVLVDGGADINKRDYDGNTPLYHAIWASTLEAKRDLAQQCVRFLFSSGSWGIWAGSFHRVLRSVSVTPEVIEIILNTYENIPISYKWRQSIPDYVYEENKDFYDWLFKMALSPRSLMHLSRFSLRKFLGSRCYSVFNSTSLSIPDRLKRYLLLEPQGVVH